MNESSNFEILTASRNWRATPWDYSSSRWLRFYDDIKADLCFGYGQTIYALIKCQFELTAENFLRLTYLDSPMFQRFQGFMPNDQNRTKDIQYKLKQEIVTGVESIVARDYKFLWTLTLNESPYPKELIFPYEVPLIYYGHEKNLAADFRG